MDTTHKAGCSQPATTNLFCPACGKLLERGSLRRVRIEGFHGPESTSPRMEAFWNTGDPRCFDTSVPVGTVTAEYDPV